MKGESIACCISPKRESIISGLFEYAWEDETMQQKYWGKQPNLVSSKRQEVTKERAHDSYLFSHLREKPLHLTTLTLLHYHLAYADLGEILMGSLFGLS